MSWRNTEERYGFVAAGLHWLIALIVIGLLALGLYMTGLKASPDKLNLYALHKSVGATVLILVALRLGWRLNGTRVTPLLTHRKWEKFLAHGTHFLLYAALFVMPLTGWIGSSAKGYTVSVFGLFTLPDLVGESKQLAKLCYRIHDTVAWTLIGLIALHVAGALKHHLFDRDATLRRMMPWTKLVPCLLLALLLAAPARACDMTHWVVNREQSSLTFEGTQQGAPFTGKFGSFDGEITFDPARLADSRAVIKIRMNDVATGSSERDDYIGNDVWLAAESFPESVFTVKQFEKKEDGSYLAHGELTLKGVTLPVDLPFTLDIATDEAGNKVAKMQGSAALQRLDFGVGSGEWADTKSVGNPVTVRVSLVATAPAPAKP